MVSSLLILYFLQEIHNGMLTVGTCRISLHNSLQIFSSISLFPGLLKEERKSPEEIEWFLEDLFLEAFVHSLYQSIPKVYAHVSFFSFPLLLEVFLGYAYKISSIGDCL